MNKYTAILMIVLVGLGFYLGYNTQKIVETGRSDSTFVADTSTKEIEYRDPPPEMVRAVIDSMLRDTLSKALQSLPVYKDTVIDTSVTYIPYAKLEIPYTLGYFKKGRFVQQGVLEELRYYPGLNHFYIDYNPTPPPITSVTNTKTVIQTVYRQEPWLLDEKLWGLAGLTAGLILGIKL